MSKNFGKYFQEHSKMMTLDKHKLIINIINLTPDINYIIYIYYYVLLFMYILFLQTVYEYVNYLLVIEYRLELLRLE